jgi:hypothetical protein
MMKGTIFLAVALLFSACATSSDNAPRYTYNEVLIINNSKELIQNVTIRSADNERFFSCDNIAPLGICSNRFGRRPYKQDPFSIEWVFGNRARQTDEVTVKVPAYSSPGVPLRGVLEISPQGTITAYFEQDSRGH